VTKNSAEMKITAVLSCRVYQLLLIAYPSEFRREYGPQMLQVFRDCYREEARRNSQLAIAGYWVRTLLDLALTAAREHSQNLRKDHVMSTLRRDFVALAGCIAIIAIAMALLSYGRNHEVRSILYFGYTLDAIATTGILGNLIVFLLVKTTKREPLRIALWTFVAVHALLLTVIAIIGPRMGGYFSFGATLVAYVLSFLFWFGLHWAWHLTKTQLANPDA
jgi:hypothetical protein